MILVVQVVDIERDIKHAKEGKGDLIYKTLVGLKADLSEPQKKPEILENEEKVRSEFSSSEGESESDEELSGEDEDSEEGSKFVNSARPRNESLEDKKARKKAVKDERAEKRKSKVKKHVKKRKERILKKK